MQLLASYCTRGATVKISKTPDGRYLVEEYTRPDAFDFREYYDDLHTAREMFWECTNNHTIA